MINEVILVGKIQEIEEANNKKKIKLQVERPFDDNNGRVSDVFTCQLWSSIFAKILSVSKKGDMLAIRGRMANENNEFLVIAEKVVLLNKSRENILKDK